MIKSVALFVFFLFMALAPSFGQLYYYEKFGVENGLSQSNIDALYEDDFGFLWIATRGGGVCRFDGKQFVVYNEKDGIPGEIVTSVTKSAMGHVIVGSTWGGVSEFKEGRFKNVNTITGYSGTSAIVTANGVTWLASSSSGLFWIKDNVINRMVEEELESQTINSMYAANGLLYALSYNKIFVIDIKSKNLVKTVEFTLPTEASIIQIVKNTIYIATKGSGIYSAPLQGILKIKNKGSLLFLPLINNISKKVNFIYVDNSNEIWTAFDDQKLYNIKNNHIQENKSFAFQGLGDFTTMLIDRGGTIWLGTDASGLLKITDPLFINFTNIPFLNQSNLFAITSDDNGNIWVGSRTNGIAVYNQEKGVVKQFEVLNGHKVSVHTLAFNNNKVYAGTDKGLFCIDPQTYKIIGQPLFPDIVVKAVAFLPDGTMAVGTAGKGLFLKTPNNEIKVYNEKSGFIHNYVHALLIDHENKLWAGTGNGIAYLTPSNGKVKVIDNALLCNSYVGCISQDKFHNIWFSTDRCLMKYDGLKVDKIDRQNGLFSNTLYFVKCDSKNNIWVGSNAGVDKLVLGPYGKIEKINHFSMEDGFIGNECNARAVHETKDGKIFFCGIKGLIEYVGEDDMSYVCNHNVLINGLSVFYTPENFASIDHGESKKGTSIFVNPVFGYHQNHLTFQFLCTEKCKPNDVSFSFKLENFDKKWSPPVKTSLATYSNLPAGDYVFKVKSLDKDNQPTGVLDSYAFTITAPFWLKPWFYIVAGIVFFGILAFLKFRAEQKEEFQRVQLEKKVNQRTIELTKQKEERELLLKEIHHRVKNNLQIINSLINLQAGQIKDAESLRVFEECRNRIKSMAIIHTKFYESTDFSKIDLADYVQHLVKDLIHTYNIDKKIELKCNINSIQMGIDTVIPLGLVLNEIISNSLKYAFANTNSGVINISLYRNLNTGEFEMTIGDNGVGFDKKSFIKNTTDSLGFELIKILSEQLNGTVTLLEEPGTVYRLVFQEVKEDRLPLHTQNETL